MIKLLVTLALLLFACSNNPDDPAGPMLGSWQYQRGEAQYFCDDGQAGWLSVNPDSVAEITREQGEPAGVRITYAGQCPNGFAFRQGDEPEEGWISQAEVCTYEDANAFGHFTVTLTNTSTSSLHLSEDEATLTDRAEHRYVFAYDEFTQTCDLFSLGFAVRVGDQ